jgi:hypothetical protein
VITPGKGRGATHSVQETGGSASDRRLELKPAGRATEATFYLNASFFSLQYSIRAPSGEPLFEDVRQVQATSLERART